MWAINFGKYRKGRRAQIQMYHNPSPTPAPVPAPVFPAPRQNSSWLWQRSWGLGGEYCPKPRIPEKHKNNTPQRWSQINKSCLQGMTARQEEQMYPSSYPGGRQRYPSWTANCVQHHEHFTPHRHKASLILHLIQLSMSTVTKHISIYSLPPFISSHAQKLNWLLNKESSATLITEKNHRKLFLPGSSNWAQLHLENDTKPKDNHIIHLTKATKYIIAGC